MKLKNSLNKFLLIALKEFLKNLKWILIALFILYILSGFFTIKQNEIGIIELFGKIINSNVKPGISWTLPFCKITKVSVKEVKTLKLDDFAREYEEGSQAALYNGTTDLTPYCITGDNNIVTISLLIKYTIQNPVNYIYRIKDNKEFLRGICASTVVKFISKISVDQILTYGKENMIVTIKQQIQNELDYYKSGIHIDFIELNSVLPPEEVQSYFDSVVKAKIEKKRMINNAQLYKNQKIPETRAQAQKLIQQALAYKNEKINHAKGDVQRYEAYYSQYVKSKNVNKTKLLLEYLSKILPTLKQIIVVDKNGNKNYLNLKYYPSNTNQKK